MLLRGIAYDVTVKCEILRFPFDHLILAHNENEKIDAFQSLHRLYPKRLICSVIAEIVVGFWLTFARLII